MANFVDFSLYDEKGKRYITKVTPAEAASLEIDGNKCFQRLQMMKNASSSNPSSSKTETRKRKWDAKATDKLLQECIKYRRWLRHKIPPPGVWDTITKAIIEALAPLAQYEGHYVYAVSEVKEKMRTLKYTFKEAKSGKHGHEKWAHFWLMTHIYDSDINEGEVTLAPEGVHFFDTSIEQEQTFEVLNGTLVPLASSSLINSSHDLISSPLAKKGKKDKSPCIMGISLKSASKSSPRKRKICKPSTNLFEIDDDDDDVGGINVLNENPEVGDVDGQQNVEFNSRRALTISNIPPTSVVSSPTKTMGKKTPGPSVNANILKSPHKNSPRKRKTPKHVLNFESDTTELFVSVCVEHKALLHNESVQIKTWKDISAALETKHKVIINWDVCRDKFSQMKEFFLSTLLPMEGYMSGKKWPYYDSFCELYDIPSEYHSIICHTEDGREDEDDEEDPGKGSKLWPSTNVELFLDLYKTKKEKFESTKSFLKHKLLFSQIAMQLHDFTGRQYTSKQCQNKMERLNIHFRIEYDKANKTGAAPSTWEHYEKMLAMFKGNPTLVAPFLSSVGTRLKYCENGVEQACGDSEVGSRSRAKTEKKQNSNEDIYGKLLGKVSLKKNFKSYQEVQVSKLENQVVLNNELRLLRLTIEQGGIDRKAYMEKLIAKL